MAVDSYQVAFAPRAFDDYKRWRKEDPALLARIDQLLDVIGRDPFRGIGKPEPLKGDLAGFWSRRIDGRHRLVYQLSQEIRRKGYTQARITTLHIASCRYHYGAD